jgi:hypothetical protein
MGKISVSPLQLSAVCGGEPLEASQRSHIAGGHVFPPEPEEPCYLAKDGRYAAHDLLRCPISSEGVNARVPRALLVSPIFATLARTGPSVDDVSTKVNQVWQQVGPMKKYRQNALPSRPIVS